MLYRSDILLARSIYSQWRLKSIIARSASIWAFADIECAGMRCNARPGLRLPRGRGESAKSVAHYGSEVLPPVLYPLRATDRKFAKTFPQGSSRVENHTTMNRNLFS